MSASKKCKCAWETERFKQYNWFRPYCEFKIFLGVQFDRKKKGVRAQSDQAGIWLDRDKPAVRDEWCKGSNVDYVWASLHSWAEPETKTNSIEPPIGKVGAVFDERTTEDPEQPGQITRMNYLSLRKEQGIYITHSSSHILIEPLQERKHRFILWRC